MWNIDSTVLAVWIENVGDNYYQKEDQDNQTSHNYGRGYFILMTLQKQTLFPLLKINFLAEVENWNVFYIVRLEFLCSVEKWSPHDSQAALY